MNIVEYDNISKDIVRQATDLVNCDAVKIGYQASGHPQNLVYLNLQSMALKRVKKYFMLMNPNDPYMRRILADVKLIIAKHLRQKYISRQERWSYNYIQEADREVRDYFARIHEKQKEFAALEKSNAAG